MKQTITKLVAAALVVGVLGAFALLLKGGPLLAQTLQSAAGPSSSVASVDGAAGAAAGAQTITVVDREGADVEGDDADSDAAKGDDREEDCMGAFNVKIERQGGPGEGMFFSTIDDGPFDVLIDAPQQVGGAIAAAIAQQLELVDSTGLLVAGVVKDSAAAKAGLRRGDIILSVDGKALGDTPILDGLETVAGKKAGDNVQLKVKRGDADATLTLTLPASTVEGQAHGFIGVLPALGGHGPAKLFMKHLGGPIGSVMDVVADTPAAKAGIKAGERIVSVDGQKPEAGKGVAELIAAHKPGDTVTLEVAAKDAKDEAARKVTVTLAENPAKKGTAFLGVKVGAAVDVKMMHDGSMHDGSIHNGMMPRMHQWLQRRFGKPLDAQPASPLSPDKAAPGSAAPSTAPRVQPAPGGSSM